MKRCPSCNRTYTNDAQKFCTKDGTSLVAVPTGGLGETVRLDSSDLKTTQDDPEVTKVISRDAGQGTGDFDPYKTIMARPAQTSADLSLTTGDLMPASIPPTPRPADIPQVAPPPPPPPPSQPPPQHSAPINPPSQPLEDSSADIGQLTMASFAPPPPPPPSGQLSAMPAPAPVPMAPPAVAPAAAAPKKKSKLPLILGILLILFFLGVGGAGAAYFFVVKPMLDKRKEAKIDQTEPPRETNTPQAANTPAESTEPKVDKTDVPPYTAPADAVQFVNSKSRLDGKLAEHYVDFSFYYPQRWIKDPTAGVVGASNFAKVERRLPPDFTQENFAVGWYSSAGSEEGDRAAFPGLAANLSSQFAKTRGFTEYKKVSEGSTKVGPYDAYEFRFESVSRNTERGDIQIWGRVIFLPPVDGGKNGVTLLMLATSLAPELKSVDDVGVKGDLPMMLESFRFGK